MRLAHTRINIPIKMISVPQRVKLPTFSKIVSEWGKSADKVKRSEQNSLFFPQMFKTQFLLLAPLKDTGDKSELSTSNSITLLSVSSESHNIF